MAQTYIDAAAEQEARIAEMMQTAESINAQEMLLGQDKTNYSVLQVRGGYCWGMGFQGVGGQGMGA